jgi:WD40 repeat protein
MARANPELFLSHAWAEEGGDTTFIYRLRRDLERNGYKVWLDAENMPSRGRALSREVTDQIDKADRVIAVVGPAWLESEPCQTERSYAIQRGKVVTPILRVGKYEKLSPELTKVFVPDFRTDHTRALADLLRVLASPVSAAGQLLGVPALPPHYQRRMEVIERLSKAVLAGKLDASIADSGRHIVALQGMGGAGKSVLAAAFAREYMVRREFLDGIVWLSVGQAPNVLSILQNTAVALGGDAGAYTDLVRALPLMTRALAGKTCLLVLDNVWNLDSVENFVNALGLKCRLLVTTRDAGLAEGLGAELISVGTLGDAAAWKMLSEWAGTAVTQLSPELRAVAAECGTLPLALAQCGASARAGTSWPDLLDALRNADLSYIAKHMPNYGYDNVFKVIQASVDALAAEDGQAAGQRYLELAVFPPGAGIPEAAIVTLWAGAGMKERDARNLLTHVKSRSMMERVEGESPNRRFWIHDLNGDYLRVTQGDLLPLHERLLLAYQSQCRDGWHSGPDDGYLFEHLAYHLRAAGRTGEVRSLLLDFDWLQAKLDNTGVAALLLDFDAGSADADLVLVGSAVRMSAEALASDRAQLAGQLVGRLQAEDSSVLAELLTRAKSWKSHPWLLPMSASLTPPRGPLLWTFAQSDDIKAVAVVAAPSGTDWWAVSVTFHGQARVWDLTKGEEVRGTPFDGVEVGALAVTPDGNMLAFSSGMNEVKTWSGGSVGKPRTLEATMADALAITPDGKRLVCATFEKLTFWEIEPVRQLWSIEAPDLTDASIRITPDGKQLLGGCGNALKVWDLGSGREVWSLIGHEHDVNAAVGIELGGRRLAVSGSNDATLKVWNLDTGKELRTLTGHHRVVFALAAVPCQPGKRPRVVSASGDGTLRVWDLETGELTKTVLGHSLLVYAVAVTPDGRRAVSGSYDRTVKVWDLDSGEGPVPDQGFACVSVTPDGRSAVFGCWDGTLTRWDLKKPEGIVSSGAMVGAIQRVEIAGDGKRLVCATRSAYLGIWDLESAGFYFEAHRELIGALTLTPSGSQAISCTFRGELKLWDAASGQELRTLQLNTQMACSLAVTPDGGQVALADLKALRIFDFESWNEIMTLHSPLGDPRRVTFTPDGRQLVAGLSSGSIVVWDLDSFAQVQVFQGHSAAVVKLAASADGSRLVSASSDRTVKLWDKVTGGLIATFTADGMFQDVAITPDARTIVAVDALGCGHFLAVKE